MNVHNAGEKWHYAPMATRLAQQGILTCVLQYSLYPEARAQDMVAEVSSALSWTLDNITQYGGNPSKVLLASAKTALPQIPVQPLIKNRHVFCDTFCRAFKHAENI